MITGATPKVDGLETAWAIESAEAKEKRRPKPSFWSRYWQYPAFPPLSQTPPANRPGSSAPRMIAPWSAARSTAGPR